MSASTVQNDESRLLVFESSRTVQLTVRALFVVSFVAFPRILNAQELDDARAPMRALVEYFSTHPTGECQVVSIEGERVLECRTAVTHFDLGNYCEVDIEAHRFSVFQVFLRDFIRRFLANMPRFRMLDYEIYIDGYSDGTEFSADGFEHHYRCPTDDDFGQDAIGRETENPHSRLAYFRSLTIWQLMNEIFRDSGMPLGFPHVVGTRALHQGPGRVILSADRFREAGEEFRTVRVVVRVYPNLMLRCPPGTHTSVVGGFESCLPNCPSGTRLYAFQGNVMCLRDCPEGEALRETDSGTVECNEISDEEQEVLAPPSVVVEREGSDIFLAFQLALGGAYLHPENMGFVEAGVTIFSERVAFNTTLGFAHNFDATRIGWSYQMRFIFPSLFGESMRVQPYIGVHAMSFNTHYSDSVVRPTRLYLGKIGIDIVAYSNRWTRLLVDIGGFLGAYHRNISYISGAAEHQREEFSFSGGAQLALRWDVH